MIKNNILLISKFYETDGGTILFKSQLKRTKEKFISIEIKGINNLLVDLYYSKIFSLYKSFGFPFFGFISSFLVSKITRLFFDKYNYLLNDIINQKTIVFCPTEDILTLIIASEIKNKSGCKIHLSVFDLPETYYKTKNSKLYFKDLFYKFYRKIDTVDFISYGMKTYCDAIIKKKSIVTYGVKTDIEKVKKEKYNSKKIAFIGSMRFKKLFEDFALKLLNIDSEYKIILFSNYNSPSKNVINLGFVEEKKLLDSLKGIKLGLILLPSNSNNELLANTSFPSKTFTYLKSGMKVISISDDKSEISKFIKKFDIGIALRDIEILNSSMLSNIDNYKNFNKSIKKINSLNKSINKFFQNICAES